jgi:hypothetical protein
LWRKKQARQLASCGGACLYFPHGETGRTAAPARFTHQPRRPQPRDRQNLSGFNRESHTLPDAVNATTTAFLGKLCAAELTAEGEGYFQRARTALGYKRTDLSLAVASPAVQLTASDFILEIVYALEKTDSGHHLVTRTLHSLSGGELVERPAFDTLFTGVFSSIVFGLTRGVPVEAVVDAIEARGARSDLTVSYPSDCRHCILSVEGVGACVVCDGDTLEMRFPRNGSPCELITEFTVLRSAFAMTGNRVLAGLL